MADHKESYISRIKVINSVGIRCQQFCPKAFGPGDVLKLFYNPEP